MFVRRYWSVGSWSKDQKRFMTTSKRVQDRSKLKRIHDLEIVTEKWKIASKVLFLMEILKKEPEMIIPVRSLDQYRSQISLPKPHRVSDFIRKSPKLFELLALDKIVHFRRDFALPVDFRTGWVHKYPQHFKLVKDEEGLEYLELVNWNPAWAITELEKKTMGITEASEDHTPGLLSISFPLKLPPNYKKAYKYRGAIDHFQKRSYLSPYADARGLKAGSKEFDKRAVAIMHELLSFTVEKRLVTDHLTHFRRELVMPQKLMRLLLKHFGIFYVSERGKRFSVFLKEAYEGSELIEKSPLVLWKEKVQSLIGYRGKKKIETFSDMSDMEDNGFDESQSENEDIDLQIEQGETEGDMEDDSLGGNSEMDIDEVCSAYEDNTKRC
ncbi:protein ROOT PRIMORDIUM DEFECTIVE 1 [Prunus yedoensis var. nudiflora]|uniref:Protein ROOT PRIMORDIUM DEFECTIVE 1 n=1 Tax=Prunus yedoensis var. nudiflora TaxID=2094558 RepID=A0A314V576_PRUYE|nr:protein ROOT PRIMORDIUM DEFECTIVE 1 [Prunus yedoensis var. nudiflora]